MEPQGFYTEEVRKGGERTGFDVITLDGQRGPLSRISKDKKASQPTVRTVRMSAHIKAHAQECSLRHSFLFCLVHVCVQVGSYVVDLPSFERLALPSLTLAQTASTSGNGTGRKRARSSSNNSRPSVVVIDEVGKMELFSTAFQARVSELLDNADVVVLGSVPMPRYGREIDFVGRVKCVASDVLWTHTGLSFLPFYRDTHHTPIFIHTRQGPAGCQAGEGAQGDAGRDLRRDAHTRHGGARAAVASCC